MTRFLRKIYLILTLKCEESAHLTSDSFDRELDWSEYWATKLHRMICSKSRRLNQQLIQLNRSLHSGGELLGNLPDMPLAARERIRGKLRGLDADGDGDGDEK